MSHYALEPCPPPCTLMHHPRCHTQHPPTPISDHARYRWLLNVDGMSASTRMGFLMTTDSAILKSRCGAGPDTGQLHVVRGGRACLRSGSLSQCF